jgi:hypothetical protein
MAVLQAGQQLVAVALDKLGIERTIGGLEVLFEVLVDKLENKVQSSITVYNVVQFDNIGMSKLAEHGDLAQGGTGDALILNLQADTLLVDDDGSMS